MAKKIKSTLFKEVKEIKELPEDVIKIHIDGVCVGFLQTDSVYTKIKGKNIQLCFPKSENISRFNGQDVTVFVKDGLYHIYE